jgi:benzoate/toluate 1,2-dioxygenase beta subunit
MARTLDDLLLVREIEEFLFHEARLLDERRFEDWMTLFTEDGIYWVPALPGQTAATDQVSIFHDDRELMEVRIRRLRHPHNYAQAPPSRTRHLVGNVVVEDVDGHGEIHVRSSLVMAEFRADEQRLFAAECRHRLRRVDGALRIAWKRVDLVDCDAPHGHMSVPF